MPDDDGPSPRETVHLTLTQVDRLALFGRNDRHLSAIESRFGVSLVARGDRLLIHGAGEAVREAAALVGGLIERLQRAPMDEDELASLVEQRPELPAAGDDRDLKTFRATIRARTAGQGGYLRAIDHHDVVFAIGPAGTGKTYLAVAMAVAAFRQKRVSRILLARPAVEAGENLGFLPGALEDKVDPYLRPLYDALQDLMEPERLRRLQEMKIVEVVPLAYMRGRTLNDAFIILDEAQNTTPPQMKMFLTRLGRNSKAVVTGDITQTDLPDGQPCGLIDVQDILKGIPGIAFVYLNERDVVRNPLVQEIVRAYDRVSRQPQPVAPAAAPPTP